MELLNRQIPTWTFTDVIKMVRGFFYRFVTLVVGIMVGQTSIIVGTEYTVVVSFGEMLTPLLEIQIESCDIGTMRVIENASVVSKFSDMVSLTGHVPSDVAEMERAIAFDFRAFVIENETHIEVSCELSMVPTENEEATTTAPMANY